MEGLRSLKEGEAVEFTFKKSTKGLESIRVTGPGGMLGVRGSQRGRTYRSTDPKETGATTAVV
jgi:protein lin-28